MRTWKGWTLISGIDATEETHRGSPRRVSSRLCRTNGDERLPEVLGEVAQH
jgi:hypothetical protein